jgi:hypothetical protein
MRSVDDKLILEKHSPDGASRSTVIWTFLDDASISEEPFPFAGDILGVNLTGLTGTGIGVTPLFSAQKKRHFPYNSEDRLHSDSRLWVANSYCAHVAAPVETA